MAEQECQSLDLLKLPASYLWELWQGSSILCGHMPKAYALAVRCLESQVGVQAPIHSFNDYPDRAIPKPSRKPVDEFAIETLYAMRSEKPSLRQRFFDESEFIDQVAEFSQASRFEFVN